MAHIDLISDIHQRSRRDSVEERGLNSITAVQGWPYRIRLARATIRKTDSNTVMAMGNMVPVALKVAVMLENERIQDRLPRPTEDQDEGLATVLHLQLSCEYSEV